MIPQHQISINKRFCIPEAMTQTDYLGNVNIIRQPDSLFIVTPSNIGLALSIHESLAGIPLSIDWLVGQGCTLDFKNSVLVGKDVKIVETFKGVFMIYKKSNGLKEIHFQHEFQELVWFLIDKELKG